MVWVEFIISSLLIVFVAVKLAEYGDALAVRTGLGGLFVGTLLIAGATSLPEVLTTISSLQIGQPNLAAGNLFGSNMFNMFALGLTDFIYTDGRFLEVIDPAFALIGMLGLLMTAVALVGNLARLERRIWFIEVDALALFILYAAGMWLLYQRGM